MDTHTASVIATNIYELHDSVSCRWTALRHPTVDEVAAIQSELRAYESNSTLALYKNGVLVSVFCDEPWSPAETMAAHLAEFGR